jgi:OTU domain-containing protein 3
LELQALSLLLRVNINVHQAGQPVWAINNFPPRAAASLNLSYHNGDHYNSVRRQVRPAPLTVFEW